MQPLSMTTSSPSHDLGEPIPAHYQILSDDEKVEISGGSKGYPSIVVFVFVLNVTVGAGVMGMPYAVGHGGLVVGFVVLFIVSSIASISAQWMVEVQGRAEAICSAQEQYGDNQIDMARGFPHPVISSRMFEFSQLCEMFLTWKGRIAWEVVLTVYSVGAMWLYSAMWATAMTVRVPLPYVADTTCDITGDNPPQNCQNAYLVYLSIFMILMLWISMKDLSGQIKFQVTLTMSALSIMIIMVLTMVYGMFHTCYNDDCSRTSAPYIQNKIIYGGPGFGPLFSACLFSQVAHHGLPGVTVLAKNKKAVAPMCTAVFMSTCVLYILVNVCAALYFGVDTSHGLNKMVTINWKGFPWDHDPTSWYSTGVQWLIMLFPAVTTGAAFPLYAVTLGNMYALTFRKVTRGKVSELWVTRICRGTAVIPPIIGAMVVRNISSVLTFTGTLGICIMFVFPGVLQIASKNAFVHIWGKHSDGTPYSNMFSARWVVYVVIGFGALCFAEVMISTILSFFDINI